MKTILKVLFLLVALAAAVPVFAQSDYEAAKALAETGDAEAQVSLGTMYRNGEGVVQNDQEAVKWYRLAAEQGLVYGQLDLGRMYRDGTFVAKDNLKAYVWFSVAATTRERFYNSFANHRAVKERDETRQLLDPQALEQAQAQATRCFESNFKDCGE
jgi:TPR repeat protein